MASKSRKSSKNKSTSKNQHYSYSVIFPRRKDFPLNDIAEWLEKITVHKWHYTNSKHQVLYEFENLDDAFKFRLEFSEHIDR